MVELSNKEKLMIAGTIILIVGAIAYSNVRIAETNKDFTTRLLVLNKEIVTNLNELQQDLDKSMSTLKNNLTVEIGVIDMSLQNFRKKNELDIAALNSIINEIERQSDIKLEELKHEISTIQVKSKDFSAIIDDVVKSVVSVGTNSGQGSGVVIDDRGFVVTNHHVIEDASAIRVMTHDSKVYSATLIGFNDVVDIAVLKVDADLGDLRFGDSEEVKVGERVIALGNPAGLSFTVTEGIVSAVHRVGPNGLNVYLQTDVPINPGNSGGPLVDANSRIVGINNFKVSGFEGLGFAIESNLVEEVAEDIIDQYLAQVQE
jgi:S1-C subfamily serine protease